jgi:hypothetical protein
VILLAAFLASAVSSASAQPAIEVHGASRRERTVRMSTPAMFRLADLAALKGDTASASAIYTALESNPDSDIRSEARFRHAKQLLGERRNRDAALLLRRLVDEKPEATAARLELARVLQLLGDSDAALRELRAIRSSGLPPQVARLIDRYSEALRAGRPHDASLEIALAPDSYINRATRSDTLGTIFGDFDIGQDSKAKSGVGVSVRGQAYRRLSLGGDDVLLFRVGGSGDLYGKARFNAIALDFAGGPELRLGGNQLNLELGGTQRWFGQKPYLRSARIGATWTRPLGSRMQLRLNGTASLIDNRLNDRQDGKGYAGRVQVERALSPTTGIGANLSFNREALKDPGYATAGWRAGLVGWRELGRMTFTASAEFGKLRADERLVLFPERRSDRYASLSLGATFRQLQWRGFAPVARLSVERNRSTIAFYDYRRTRSEIGVVRAF